MRTSWMSVAAVATLAGVVVPAAAAPRGKPIVAVFDIENRGTALSRDFLDRLRNSLATQLARSGVFEVIPQDALRERLERQKRDSYSDCFAESCQIDLGRELAADKSLATVVQKVGRTCEVTSNLYDLARATAELAASAEGPCSEDGVREALRQVGDELAARTRDRIAPLPGDGASPRSTATVQPGMAMDQGEGIVNQITDRTGLLFIRTEPSGATIRLNGKEIGRSPVQVEQMVGRYVVTADVGRLYHPARQEIDLTTAGARVSMTLLPAYGRLEVESDPRGAEVWLDGERMGETPWAADRKPSATYRLRVVKANFRAWEGTVVVQDGKTARQAVTLESHAGTLVVTSRPAGARIQLNDEDTGQVTPYTFPALQPGVYAVRLTRDGFGALLERATVRNREETTLSLVLPAKLGLLTVFSEAPDGTPCEGELQVDGERVGRTPWKGEVTASRHRVRVSCDGATGEVESVVEHNDRATAKVVVQGTGAAARRGPVLGFLRVDGGCAGGEVWVDGVSLGAVRPPAGR